MCIKQIMNVDNVDNFVCSDENNFVRVEKIVDNGYPGMSK